MFSSICLFCGAEVRFLRVCSIASTKEGTVPLKASHEMLDWGWWGWPLFLDGRREAGHRKLHCSSVSCSKL